MSIDFKGFAEYAAKLEELNGDLKATSEKALQNTHDFLTPRLHKDMKRHRQTGKTEAAIADKAKVEWEGNHASIDVGFGISNGGLPSVFLMYGTPRHQPANQYGRNRGNHPGTRQDLKLYEDIYGKKTRKDIKTLQEKTFARAIKKAMEG